MSCESTQNSIAGQPATAAGISRKASKNANAAGSGAVPVVKARKKAPARARRPRKVRQAIKAYRKLPLTKKEKLWKVMGQAALEKGDDKKRLRRLIAATREFGPGVVAAAVATEIQKAKKEGDTWTQERYQKLADMLPKAAKATKKAESSIAKAADLTKKAADSQKNFFQKTNSAGKGSKSQAAPRKIRMDGVFSPDEIQQVWLQLSFGGAAARRHMKMLSSGHARGHTHTDPREGDWVQQDSSNFAFLSGQLRRAKNGDRSIDTSSLNEAELVDLWEFSRFEADRAHRNIDHLQAGLSHLKGESADYFTGRHKVEAKFFTFLANELEPAITTAMKDKYGSVEV